MTTSHPSFSASVNNKPEEGGATGAADKSNNAVPSGSQHRLTEKELSALQQEQSASAAVADSPPPSSPLLPAGSPVNTTNAAAAADRKASLTLADRANFHSPPSALLNKGDQVVERYVLSELNANKDLDDAVEKAKSILESSLYNCARQSLFHIAQNREELQRQRRDFDSEQLRQEFEAKKLLAREEEIKRREDSIKRREEHMQRQEDRLAQRERALERVQIFANEELRRQRLMSTRDLELSHVVLEHLRRLELNTAETPQQMFLVNVSKFLSEQEAAIKERQQARTPSPSSSRHSRDQQEQQSQHGPAASAAAEGEGEDHEVYRPTAEELVVSAFHPLRPPSRAVSPSCGAAAAPTSSVRHHLLMQRQQQQPSPFFLTVEAAPALFYKLQRDWSLDVCPLHVRGGRAIHVTREVSPTNFPLSHPALQQEGSSSQSRRHFQFNVLGGANAGAPGSNGRYLIPTRTTCGEAVFDIELFPPKVIRSVVLLSADIAVSAAQLQHDVATGIRNRPGSADSDNNQQQHYSSMYSLDGLSPERNEAAFASAFNASSSSPTQQLESIVQKRAAATSAAGVHAFRSPIISFVYFAPREGNGGKRIKNDGAVVRKKMTPTPRAAAAADDVDDEQHPPDDKADDKENEQQHQQQQASGDLPVVHDDEEMENDADDENSLHPRFEDSIVLFLGSVSESQPASSFNPTPPSGGSSAGRPGSAAARRASTATASAGATKTIPEGLENAALSAAAAAHVAGKKRGITVQNIVARVPISEFRDPEGDINEASRMGRQDSVATAAAVGSSIALDVFVDLVGKSMTVSRTPKKAVLFGAAATDPGASSRIGDALIQSGLTDLAPGSAHMPVQSSVHAFDAGCFSSPQVRAALVANEASLYLGLMVTSPCGAVEFSKVVSQHELYLQQQREVMMLNKSKNMLMGSSMMMSSSGRGSSGGGPSRPMSASMMAASNMMAVHPLASREDTPRGETPSLPQHLVEEL